MKKIDLKSPPPLWVRIVFYFLLLSAVILLLFQAIFGYSLERHLQAYSRDREETLNSQIVNTLIEYYSAAGSWSGIQMPLLHAAMSTGTRLLLSDAEGQLIADTGLGRHQHMRMVPAQQPDLSGTENYYYVLKEGDVTIGELTIAHPVTAEISIWRQQDLILQDALSRSLLWTGLIAISAALVLGVLFSRRLTSPLEEISKAAVRITRGDYSRRLPGYRSRELNNLAQCFNQLTHHLQELEKLRKRSVADISHELRTPLATLRSYVEAVRDGVLPADENTMAVLLDEVMHLSRVAVAMDELASAESKQQDQAARETVNLNRFLQDKVASFEPLYRGKGLALKLSLPEKQINAFLDPAALRKIFGNLLENAYRYTGQGGEVEVTLQENPEYDPGAVPPLGQESMPDQPADQGLKDMVLIKVRDSGIGIRQEHLPYIFERFFRADSSREREQSRAGSGIGLSLVRELTRLAGGFISVSSQPGQGTTFYLYLEQQNRL